MNDFSSTTNSGLLKADYNPEKTADSDLMQMLKRKRQRMADTRLGIKDEYPRETTESEKVTLGPIKS